MTAVTFSSQGTRWRVTTVTQEKAAEAHVPPLPGAGLLFTSADAEMRFLSLAPDALPSVEELEGKAVPELASLVSLAKPLNRQASVAYREFTDERGRTWTVWDVYPTLAERRVRDAGPPPGVRERRRFVEARTRISARMSRGWLAFEARDGERRRLAPVPDAPNGWAGAAVDQLRAWCAHAEPAPPVRRLVE